MIDDDDNNNNNNSNNNNNNNNNPTNTGVSCLWECQQPLLRGESCGGNLSPPLFPAPPTSAGHEKAVRTPQLYIAMEVNCFRLHLHQAAAPEQPGSPRVDQPGPLQHQ